MNEPVNDRRTGRAPASRALCVYLQPAVQATCQASGSLRALPHSSVPRTRTALSCNQGTWRGEALRVCPGVGGRRWSQDLNLRLLAAGWQGGPRSCGHHTSPAPRTAPGGGGPPHHFAHGKVEPLRGEELPSGSRLGVEKRLVPIGGHAEEQT